MWFQKSWVRVPLPTLFLSPAESSVYDTYWRLAKDYYVKDGRPTGSIDRIRVALRLLRETYAQTLAHEFGPLALKAIQLRLANSGRSRRYANYLIGTIRQVFKWGVSQELIPEPAYRALTTVDGLRPYLLRDKSCYCFVPAESERKRLAALHERRRTPLSCGNRPGTNRRRRPKRKPGARYDTNTYRRAVHRAVELANRKWKEEGVDKPLPKWSPNRLRHSAATEIRRQFGLEAAQVTLGHATADVSQIYAERDLSLAVEIMRKIG